MATFLKKWRVILISVLTFLLFKFFFPNPNLFLDSVGYLAWGLDDYPIAYRPLGYTRFLMFFRSFPYNYINIVVVQYAVFVACTWYFNQTIFRIFRIGPRAQWIFWLLTLFNPVCYFLFNFISSDSLFISLSALWLATLLRFIFYSEKKYHNLAAHLVCFIALFYLRYNAIYYPFFSAAIILFCNMKLMKKVLFAGLSLAVFAVLYNSILNDSEEKTGARVLSGFSGWLLANNAMHIQDVTTVDSNIFEDPEQKLIHRFVLAFRDSVKRDDGAGQITDQYMWSKSGPFKRYLGYCLATGRYTDYLVGWWNVSIPFNEYATTLIRHYPGAFLKGYYFRNLRYYPMPPPEVLEKFDPYNTALSDREQAYFDYKGKYFTARLPEAEHALVAGVNLVNAVLSPLAVLAALCCIVLFILHFIRRRGRDLDQMQLAAFILSVFYIVSVALLAATAPILIRYVALLHIYFNSLLLLVLIAYNGRIRQMFTTEAAPDRH